MRNRLNKIKAFGAAGALLLSATGASTLVKADVISDWNATAANVIVAKGAPGGVYLALVHVAIYDAVNAIDRRYSVYAVQPHSSTAGASKEAAAAAAAYGVLIGLFPDQASVLDPAYAASLAAIPDGSAETKGIAIGTEVATEWLAVRADDGRNAIVPYTFGSGPGVYQRTPPAFADPVTPWLAKMKPFAIKSPSQFRAYGPPDLTSERYANDFAAVKALGSAGSVQRTQVETEIAMFHTENPTLFWSRNLRDFVANRGLGIAGKARLYAMLFVGFGDATIACWDSKYYFNSWRPVTAIPAADTDDNPRTIADAAWAPLVPTPPHPEYPAAHGCVAGAVSEVMSDFFGTKKLTFTFTSTVAGTVPHVFHSTDDLVNEILDARVFGGMHFPTSVAHGALMGRKVGRWVDRHYFRRVN